MSLDGFVIYWLHVLVGGSAVRGLRIVLGMHVHVSFCVIEGEFGHPLNLGSGTMAGGDRVVMYCPR